ncbi:cupin domain-containing protein [Bdellovibrio bacteriovorus]|uniref:cupin domain-containing protein n=1 Tax=Bdellovibrio bacteriovorus TaxID=959 RepID=UPI0021D26A2A|nr:cupin domain-containing protein [Bdellovibrio bacteriovorus]UXR65945.1 cupin domain-containing protein [Bdellovibrio bacteriovorus]
MAMQTSSAKSAGKTDAASFAKVTGSLSVQNFTKAGEVRDFPKGKLELVKFGDAVVGRATLQPGWRWSTSVKEIAQTESCEAPHFQYHVSGILRIKMDDGTEIECKPGDVSLVPPGHDAWVVGNEPVVIVDFQGMIDYANKAPHKH